MDCKPPGNLLVDLGVGETLRLDDGRITITLGAKSGKRARLCIVGTGGVVELVRTAFAEALPGLTITHMRRG